MIPAVLEANKISAAFPYRKQRRQVLGREMAYVEVGDGDPIVLLHGKTEVTVAGVHYVQEDSPNEIGRAIASWMGTFG